MREDEAQYVKLDVQTENTWSARRAQDKPEEKELMARHFAAHEFLVPDGHSPETEPRKTVGSILVNQGTTPNVIIRECLAWVAKNQHRGPFDLTWYTPGHLIPTTLREYRYQNPHLSSATQLFLFPGRVDQQTESVAGPEAEEFGERLSRCFSYALLSSFSFDIRTGTAYFHLPEETRLQRACATRHAAEKFLFLDPTKFRTEGEAGYTVADMLVSAEALTIYTASSQYDQWLVENFNGLCSKVLDNSGMNGDRHRSDKKTLRLVIVGRSDVAAQHRFEGVLVDPP